LTRDLQAITDDLHLRVSAPGVPMRISPGTPPLRPGIGLTRADVLLDNVGYLEVDAFPAASAFNEPVAEAMAGLLDTRALIVHLHRKLIQ
jgi:hypothetical protein